MNEEFITASKRIRETSINVYHEITAKGLLSKRRMQVFKCLWENNAPMSTSEVYVKLGVPNLQQSSIMPRFAELLDMGVIDIVGERPCKITGHKVMIWDVTGRLPHKRHPKPKAVDQFVLKELISKIKALDDKIDLFYKYEMAEILRIANKLKV